MGFIVSKRGIEANPEKVSAVTNMGPIRDLKGVQRVIVDEIWSAVYLGVCPR